ncbi:hypothetical protein L2E82_14056 [Cichorium intybus]|uniref:Uncharacterized protein n=1 Tax=Cichorium intybus TaxID=13427 RepID=A0ACB9EZA0_CICIN|nr:hypothetical protein L2E82_14056 [Cichorium intybus]
MQPGQISGNLNGLMTKKVEEMSENAVSTFMAKGEEIEKNKLEVRERVQAQLVVRKKIDSVNKELKPLGQTCQKNVRVVDGEELAVVEC